MSAFLRRPAGVILHWRDAPERPSSPLPLNWVDLSIPELAEHLASQGYKPSHARRILREFYQTGGAVPVPAQNLPGKLAALLQTFGRGPEITLRQVAEDGTTKLLFRLQDGRTVEAVLMPDFNPERAAGCLSTQVGCAMGCDFCATTKSGFERNLTVGEIVAQFLALRREALNTGRILRTVVFMGMGEPMLNLPHVLTAAHRIASNEYGSLGWRQITLSTVGIVPGIEQLAAANLNVHLAVSLHGPDDATRAQLLPMAKRYRIDEVMAAADAYQAKTGRPVTVQYCLLKGVNDSLDQARALAALLKGRRMHANLLRYNPTGPSLRGISYEPCDEEATHAFLSELRAGGVVAHFRRSRGKDIDAACGQLRRRALAGENGAASALQSMPP